LARAGSVCVLPCHRLNLGQIQQRFAVLNDKVVCAAIWTPVVASLIASG
jgi:hypothetical protein